MRSTATTVAQQPPERREALAACRAVILANLDQRSSGVKQPAGKTPARAPATSEQRSKKTKR